MCVVRDCIQVVNNLRLPKLNVAFSVEFRVNLNETFVVLSYLNYFLFDLFIANSCLYILPVNQICNGVE